MAIIDPEGLFSGERLASCSDLAQLYWPRFFLASNSCARIELSYKSIISRVFGNFQSPPKSEDLWKIFREYDDNYLAILYQSESGTWWCQFITSEKYLPKYKKTRDSMSPAPPLELVDLHHTGYLEWKKSKSFQNQSFQKFSNDDESFGREGIGVGVGVGIGEGIGIIEKHSPALVISKIVDREKEVVERAFAFYCESFQKNPKQYQLTEERRKKAGLRYRERLKANEGDLDAVERDFAKCIENLAASDYHVNNGYIDWTAQIFKSQDEFERRLNWKPNNNGGTHATIPNGTGNQIVGVLQNSLGRTECQDASWEDGNLPSSIEAGRSDAGTVYAGSDQLRLESVSSSDEKPFEF